MKTLLLAVLVSASVLTVAAGAAEKSTPAVLNFKMKSLAGKDIDLAQYQGKVLLIVNVASQCGATPQYRQLQELHEKYAGQGLAVLGFPCNQFGAQEPGTAEEIAAFCKDNYAVTFDMFAKIDVNGEQAAPLYKLLTTKAPKTGPVKWNFEKFLIGRNGEIVARFPTNVKPDAPEVIRAIEAELAKSAQ
uniref:Glutathione peroxidase n=1 Tax=Schlesneria paludicola TaxID=360056 RepID=A0A7C4LJ46_9PLAN